MELEELCGTIFNEASETTSSETKEWQEKVAQLRKIIDEQEQVIRRQQQVIVEMHSKFGEMESRFAKSLGQLQVAYSKMKAEKRAVKDVHESLMTRLLKARD